MTNRAQIINCNILATLPIQDMAKAVAISHYRNEDQRLALSEPGVQSIEESFTLARTGTKTAGTQKITFALNAS